MKQSSNLIEEAINIAEGNNYPEITETLEKLRSIFSDEWAAIAEDINDAECERDDMEKERDRANQSVNMIQTELEEANEQPQGFVVVTADDQLRLDILKNLHMNCTTAQILAIEEGAIIQMGNKYIPAQ